MRVLGIDPSLTSTGVAIVADGRVESVARISCPKPTGPGAEHVRLAAILADVLRIVGRPGDLRVDAVGIEGPSFSSRGGSSHERAGLWWLITQTLWTWRVPYYVVTPSQRMIYATGSGQADKDRVIAAVVRRYLEVEVTGNDEADGLIIAAIGARMLGEPVEESLPQTHLRALAKIDARWMSAFAPA